MKVQIFSAQGVELDFLEAHPEYFNGVDVSNTSKRLTPKTVSLAAGCDAVICFVNDDLSAPMIERLGDMNILLILMRCAGYDRVDLEAAKKHGVTVLRVPAYSPWAVAEHAVTLLLALNRSIVRSSMRARDHDFYLRGLIGRDIHGKIVGIVGTGKIGRIFATIMQGFGTTVIAYDLHESEEMTSKGVKYVPLDELLQRADIISIHCPLLSSTHHIIDERAIELMKPNVLLVNCGRGPLVNTSALVKGLRSKKLGGVAMDVYEHEAELYFTDRSNEVLPDNEFLQLQSYPNVLITPHTAFLTHEALEGIWATTRKNLDAFAACIARKDGATKLENQVTV